MEGSGGASFFVIESGTVTVSVKGEHRATLGPGDYFGELALIDGGPRSATVTADTRPGLLRTHVLGVPPAGREQRRDRMEAHAGARQAAADRLSELIRLRHLINFAPRAQHRRLDDCRPTAPSRFANTHTMVPSYVVQVRARFAGLTQIRAGHASGSVRRGRTPSPSCSGDAASVGSSSPRPQPLEQLLRVRAVDRGALVGTQAVPLVKLRREVRDGGARSERPVAAEEHMIALRELQQRR